MEMVKLHGAFRSGTNYVKALLEVNYNVQLIATHGGWKHAPVPALFHRDHGWPIVGVVREPHAWLDAVWRYAQGDGSAHVVGGDTWRSFLRQPVQITHGQRSDVPTYRYASPVHYWNAMAANLLSLEARGEVIRYEDAVREPHAVAEHAAKQLDLQPSEQNFTPIDHKTRNMVDRSRSELDDYVTPHPINADAQLEETWRRQFSILDRRHVRRHLATDLVARLAYD